MDLNVGLKKYGINLRSITKGTDLLSRAMKGEADALRQINRRIKLTIQSGKLYDKQIKGFHVHHHRNAMSLSRLRSQLLMVAFAYGITIRQVGKLFKMHMKQETAEKALSAALASTGNSALLTSKQIREYAAELEDLTGIGDELILSSSALLVTFTKIRGDVFLDAQEAIVNIASAMNQGTVSAETLKTATIQVGKALNDPIKGMAALNRVGIQFTDAQKDQVEALIDSGDVMGAQKIILGELETQFGNMAKLLRFTTQGRIQAMNSAWGTLGEKLAKSLVPAMDKTTEALTKLAKAMDSESVMRWTVSVLAGATSLLAFTRTVIIAGKSVTVFTAMSQALLTIFSPGKFIKGIKAGGAAIAAFGKKLLDIITPMAAATGVTVLTNEIIKATGAFEGFNEEIDESLDEIEKIQANILKLSNGFKGLESDEDAATKSLASLTKQVILAQAAYDGESAAQIYAIEQGRKLTDLEKEQIEALENVNRLTAGKKAALETLNQTYTEGMQMLKASLDAESQILEERMNQDVERIKKTNAYKLAAKRGNDAAMDALENKARKKTLAARKRAFKEKQTVAASEILINTGVAIFKAWKDYGWPWALPITLMLGGLAAAQVGQILGEEGPKFAKGGDFVTSGPQMIMVGDNPGGRERVQVTPLSSPNISGPQGGGGININFSGNVMSQDFIEQEAIPQIKEAIRRGADIGVS